MIKYGKTINNEKPGIRFVYQEMGNIVKPWPKLETLAERKRLEYLIRCLEYAGEVFDRPTMRMALGYLDPREFLDECLDLAKDGNLISKLPYVDKNEPIAAIFLLNKNYILEKHICSRIVFYLRLLAEINMEEEIVDGLEKEVDQMAMQYGLKEIEREILVCHILRAADSISAQLLKAFDRHIGAEEKPGKNHNVIAVAIGRNIYDVEMALRDNSVLCRSGLLNGRAVAHNLPAFI
jgi:hypothetical protein